MHVIYEWKLKPWEVMKMTNDDVLFYACILMEKYNQEPNAKEKVEKKDFSKLVEDLKQLKNGR